MKMSAVRRVQLCNQIRGGPRFVSEGQCPLFAVPAGAGVGHKSTKGSFLFFVQLNWKSSRY